MSKDLAAYTTMTASNNSVSNPYQDVYIARDDESEAERLAKLSSNGQSFGEEVYDPEQDTDGLMGDLVGMTEPIDFGEAKHG